MSRVPAGGDPLARRRARTRWAGAVALVVSLVAGSPASAQDVAAIGRELTDIDADVHQLSSQPLRVTALRSTTFIEERLTDGQLFFQLRDYLRASIIFTDIVESHPRHRAFPDALFLLGESLYQAGDYLGARTRFRQVIDRANEGPFRPFVQRALGRLIEIAIHIRDFTGIEEHFQVLSRLPPSEIEATTAYFRAKYLYGRAVPEIDGVTGEGAPQIDVATLEQARQAFEAVPAGSPYYLQARYFIGVIHTLRSEYPQGIEAFRRVTREQPTTTEQRQIVDLAHLALGRLHYEADQLEQAIEAYQTVPRTSAGFDTALYEIAWVFIRLGDSTRAERALEVLSVAAPDSTKIPDAKVLRGNLLMRTGRFEEANQVFQEVREAFGPVLRELDEVRNAHEDLPGYFRQLVRANFESFDANDFLSENVRRWVELDETFDRAVRAVGDLNQARVLIEETNDLIERMSAAIHAANRVASFPDLRLQKERTTALRNRIAIVRRRLIAIEEARSGEGSAELQQVRERRRAIERDLGRMPTGSDEFSMRDDELLDRYRALSRELRELEVQLMGLDARIVATDRFMATSPNIEGDVSGLQEQLQQQRQAVVGYREEIARIARAIEIGRLQVGVGDARYQRDDALRQEYAQLVARERQLAGGRSSDLDSLFARATSIEALIDQRDARIDEVVGQRVAEIQRVLDEETENVAGYRQAMTALETETEEVVGAVTLGTFTDVRNRFYDLVLRADVGRIDVAWAEREEHRMRVDMLTRERSRDLQALDDEFRDIMDEVPQSATEEASP